MNIRFDWKFWVVLGATLAGVLVPVWLWRADLEARSVHIRKLSQTSLQPPDTAKGFDVRVSVGGSELQTAYLTVFELVNDGARPVSASEFESSIEITSKNKAEIVRASVTSTKPADLLPSISIDAGTVKIKPMLLNPGDLVTFAVLSTKDEPMFTSRARIAGVKTVPIVDAQSKSTPPLQIVISLFVGLTCFVAANLVLSAWPTDGVALRPRASFVMFMVAAFGAAVSLTAGLESVGVEGFWAYMGAFVGCMVLTSLVARWLNRPASIQR